jgi:hypothetical protein
MYDQVNGLKNLCIDALGPRYRGSGRSVAPDGWPIFSRDGPLLI